MNVLSLFDGMSCGQIALQQLGIKVDNYYASEIDKYCIQITQKNFPNTIQIGDVCDIKGTDLPKIDLIMGGSPCQGFSFAGKQLAFDDPRSKLFFEFVRLVKECQPKYFLLENVRMKKEFLAIISEHLGVEPVCINSALVSAQNRVRYYWTNILGIEQPNNKGIILRDILETQPNENLDKMTTKEGKSYCLTATYTGATAWNSIERKQRTMVPIDPDKTNQVNPSKKASGVQPYMQDRVFHEGGKSHALTESFASRTNVATKPKQVGIAVDVNGHDILKRVYSEDGKSPTLNACTGGNREPKVVCGAWRGGYYKDGARQDYKGSVAGKTKQMLELRKDDKTNTVTTVQKDNVLTKDNLYWRKLTPIECERLQTVPDNYTEGVSNTQRYKMLGNGWTVDVIAHIFKNMELPK